MRQEFDQYKDEMADVAESLEMAALDKEMAEEKVSDYEYVHVRLCVCVCVYTYIYMCRHHSRFSSIPAESVANTMKKYIHISFIILFH